MGISLKDRNKACVHTLEKIFSNFSNKKKDLSPGYFFVCLRFCLFAYYQRYIKEIRSAAEDKKIRFTANIQSDKRVFVLLKIYFLK